MTRGIVVLIDPIRVTVSVEFNGDMSDEMDRGRYIMKHLQIVDTQTEFLQMLMDFNNNYFRYNEIVWKTLLDDDEVLTRLDIDYLRNWSCDYLFIANRDLKSFFFVDRNNEVVEVPPRRTAVCKFGVFKRLR